MSILNWLLTSFSRCRVSRCTLSYVPKHLHQDNKPVIPEFYDSEKLFWRLGDKDFNTPYASISLYDVSFNRSGTQENFISAEGDVLWNLDKSQQIQRFDSKVIAVLVKRLLPEQLPLRILRHPDNDRLTVKRAVTIRLVHDPLACNYAHSMIVFEVENERVTKANYKTTFDTGPYKKLRQACRDELHKAIIRKELEI